MAFSWRTNIAMQEVRSDKSRGVEHMKSLKRLALKLGYEVPYYTATGWGGAIVLEGETLPVLGGYVDEPWAGHTHEMPACENFLMMPFRQDENIGADLQLIRARTVHSPRKTIPILQQSWVEDFR